MQFAYRMHKAFINLDPGGSMHFALPPTTSGVIVIKAEHIRSGGRARHSILPTTISTSTSMAVEVAGRQGNSPWS